MASVLTTTATLDMCELCETLPATVWIIDKRGGDWVIRHLCRPCTENFRKIHGEANMAEISAKLVNELRAKTGLGMMECKKALTEAGGDLGTAVDNLRKKGVKASLTERAAT